MLHSKSVIYLFILLLSITNGFSQISHGGRPKSLVLNNISSDKLTEIVIDRTHSKDENFPDNFFAYPIYVDLNIDNSGKWTELDDGSKIWQLRIKVPGAKSIHLTYDQFYLPPGSEFFVFNPINKSEYLGSFDHTNNKSSGMFATGIIEGNSIVLEYFQPSWVDEEAKISLLRINKAIETDFNESINDTISHFKSTLAFGASLSCNNNVNCSPIGDDFQDNKRGVVKILVEKSDGSYLCSGSLVNNTNQDRTPYLLSADHCQDPNPIYDAWVFIFNYEAPGCSNPTSSPSFQSIVGCTEMFNNSIGDVLLLKLSNPVPNSFDPFYNGWDIRNKYISSGLYYNYDEGPVYCIHHPKGDIKKISKNDAATFTPNPSSPMWYVTTWDDGTTEGGSSGSPLFSEYGRILGVLSQGTTGCNVSDDFGKLAFNWSSLDNYLSPGSTVTTLNGLDGSFCPYELNLTADIDDVDGVYEASDLLTITSRIIGNSNVTFNCSNTTILNPGFEAELGSTFKMTTASCTVGSGFRTTQANRSNIGLEKFDTDVSVGVSTPGEVTFKFELKDTKEINLLILDELGNILASPYNYELLDPGNYEKTMKIDDIGINSKLLIYSYNDGNNTKIGKIFR